MADQAANDAPSHGWYFTIKKLKNGEYAAFFRKPDGEAVCWTASFQSKAAAKNAIESLRMRAAGAPIRYTTLESQYGE